MDAPEQSSEQHPEESPDQPSGSALGRLGRAAETQGLAAAKWVGRGDEAQGISMLALGAAAASFICLFMPWLGFGGHTASGWNVPLGLDYGLLALAVVLVELLALARAWTSRSADLLTFCLVAAAGILGVSALAELRWGSFGVGGFSAFEYGAWLALVFSILLLVLAALRLAALWRPAP